MSHLFVTAETGPPGLHIFCMSCTESRSDSWERGRHGLIEDELDCKWGAGTRLSLFGWVVDGLSDLPFRGG